MTSQRGVEANSAPLLGLKCSLKERGNWGNPYLMVGGLPVFGVLGDMRFFGFCKSKLREAPWGGVLLHGKSVPLPETSLRGCLDSEKTLRLEVGGGNEGPGAAS